jgi:hypothetical protein
MIEKKLCFTFLVVTVCTASDSVNLSCTNTVTRLTVPVAAALGHVLHLALP